MGFMDSCLHWLYVSALLFCDIFSKPDDVQNVLGRDFFLLALNAKTAVMVRLAWHRLAWKVVKKILHSIVAAIHSKAIAIIAGNLVKTLVAADFLQIGRSSQIRLSFSPMHALGQEAYVQVALNSAPKCLTLPLLSWHSVQAGWLLGPIFEWLEKPKPLAIYKLYQNGVIPLLQFYAVAERVQGPLADFCELLLLPWDSPLADCQAVLTAICQDRTLSEG